MESSQPSQHIDIATHTLKNSWPTAPVTPTIAITGPSLTFAARTVARSERLGRTVRRAGGAPRTQARPCLLMACISNLTVEIHSMKIITWQTVMHRWDGDT